jgi:hypothetical protein
MTAVILSEGKAPRNDGGFCALKKIPRGEIYSFVILCAPRYGKLEKKEARQ